MPKRRFIALAVTLVLLAGFGAMIERSGHALPGDDLYPLKTFVQNARLQLTWNDQARAALADGFMQAHRAEVSAVMLRRQTSQTIQTTQVNVQFDGVLQAIDASQWLVSGLPVTLAGSNLPDASPHIGDTLRVEAVVQESGALVAHRIDLRSRTTAAPQTASSTPVSQYNEDWYCHKCVTPASASDR